MDAEDIPIPRRPPDKVGIFNPGSYRPAPPNEMTVPRSNFFQIHDWVDWNEKGTRTGFYEKMGTGPFQILDISVTTSKNPGPNGLRTKKTRLKIAKPVGKKLLVWKGNKWDTYETGDSLDNVSRVYGDHLMVVTPPSDILKLR